MTSTFGELKEHEVKQHVNVEMQPFLDLKPITMQAGTVACPDMPSVLGNGKEASTLENMYGYEIWRQRKLKTLKTIHDADGRFNLYAPIE